MPQDQGQEQLTTPQQKSAQAPRNLSSLIGDWPSDAARLPKPLKLFAGKPILPVGLLKTFIESDGVLMQLNSVVRSLVGKPGNLTMSHSHAKLTHLVRHWRQDRQQQQLAVLALLALSHPAPQGVEDAQGRAGD